MSGIYKITCKTNGRFYIGRSVNISKRFYQHKNKLKNRDHFNIIMQASYNKYGPDSFVYEVICTCPEEDLNSLEQFYIDKYWENPLLSNINVESADCAGRKCRVVNNLVGPDSPHPLPAVVNISAFCRKNKLNCTEFQRMLAGEYKSYRGYYLLGAEWSLLPSYKNEQLQDCYGELHDVVSLKDFAKQHGLNHNRLSLLINGDIDEYKGWTRPGSPLAGYSVSDPDGTVYRFGVIADFCRQQGLNLKHFNKMISGERGSYLGWRRVY